METITLPILTYDDSGDERETNSACTTLISAAAAETEHAGSALDASVTRPLADSITAAPGCVFAAESEKVAAPHGAAKDSAPEVLDSSVTADGGDGNVSGDAAIADLRGNTHAPAHSGRGIPHTTATASTDVERGSGFSRRTVAGTLGSSDAAAAGDQGADDPDVDFETKRRRAVFTAMLLLLEHGARDAAHLSKLVAPMSGEELLGVAEERALAGRCGNPLCANPHSPPRASPRRRWDPATAGFVEPAPLGHFCSAACESLVQSYAVQLGDPIERLKPGVRQLLAASHNPRRPGLENVAAQGGGVPTMMAQIQERDPVAAAAAAVAGGKTLDKMAATAGGGEGAAAAAAGGGGARGHQAVEGYVPAAASRRPAVKAAASAAAAAAAPPPARRKTDLRSIPSSTAASAAAPAADGSGGEVAAAAGRACTTPSAAAAAAGSGPGSFAPVAPAVPDGGAAVSATGMRAGAGPAVAPTAAVPSVPASGGGGEADEGAAPSPPLEVVQAETETEAEAAPPPAQPALKSSLRRGGSAKALGGGAGGSGGAQEQADKEPAKRVTFGPQVEYQLPPGAGKPGPARTEFGTPRPAGQPVLVFDVEGDDAAEDADGEGPAGGGAAGRRGLGAAAPRGTLRVAEAADVLHGGEAGAGTGAEAAAAAGRGGGLTDEDLAAAMRENALPVAPRPAPWALRMWFPPAAGGVGVGRRASSGAAQRRPPPQHQQPHSATTASSASATATANCAREPATAAAQPRGPSGTPGSTAAGLGLSLFSRRRVSSTGTGCCAGGRCICQWAGLGFALRDFLPNIQRIHRRLDQRTSSRAKPALRLLVASAWWQRRRPPPLLTAGAAASQSDVPRPRRRGGGAAKLRGDGCRQRYGETRRRRLRRRRRQRRRRPCRGCARCRGRSGASGRCWW